MAFEQVHRLHWDANTEPDLVGYRVYAGRATGNYLELNSPIEVGNVTSYSFLADDPGQWFFTVTAYDTSNNESEPGTELVTTFTPGRFTSQHTIGWIAVTLDELGNPITDLAGYRVYAGRFTTVYGSLSSPIDVGNVTSYQFTIEDSGEWFFAVTAYDTSNNESDFSTEVAKNWLMLGNIL